VEALPNFASWMISILKYSPTRDSSANTEIGWRTKSKIKKNSFWSPVALEEFIDCRYEHYQQFPDLRHFVSLFLQ